MPTFTGVSLLLAAFWAVAGPLLSKDIERRVEWLILGLGAFTLSVSWSWSERILLAALGRAGGLCGALLLGALFFSLVHGRLRDYSSRAEARFGSRAVVAAAVFLSGLAAPLVSSGVAVLLLVELLGALKLEPLGRSEAAVLGCLAVGFGSGLSAVGGPASAVLLAKLSGAAYPLGPLFLFTLVGAWAVPGIVAMALCAAALCGSSEPEAKPVDEEPLILWNLLVMTGRIFVFTAGLVLLGEGLLPLIEKRFMGIPAPGFYWTNAAAAVMDNASLVAIEMSPAMSQDQLRYGFLGMLSAGGAFLAGDAPNLVAAHALKIDARTWSRIGLPASAALMVFFFMSLVAL
ncbi:MAG: DUF1646 family protein [Elusimicrobia bacterium]|nr:DUF1646 family protein [Elusimicrobiota bacterium]